MRLTSRRPARRAGPKPATAEDRRLVVETARGPGEDMRVYERNILHPHTADQLKRGVIRLFDPATDDRGPEVPMIATWGNKLSTWHPLTEGIYVVEFIPFVKFPEGLERWRGCLGMGDCTAPQYTLAKIHRVWLDLSTRPVFEQLKSCLRIVKRPCVFCKDAPEHPGGSFVVIDPATLPPACKPGEIGRTYG